MTILHIMGVHCGKFDGIERFLLKLMKTNPQDKFVFAFNSFPGPACFVDEVKIRGGEIVVLNTTGINVVKNLLHFIRLCFQYKPKVVHFHFEFSYLLYAPLAKLLRIKRVIKTVHSCLTDRNSTQIFSKKQLTLRNRLCTLDGRIYHLIDHLVFVSEYVHQQFIKVYGDSYHLSTIYLGIEACPKLNQEEKKAVYAELNIKPGQLVIATTLFAAQMKGVDVLINTISLIENKETVFVIIGMNEELSLTKEMHQLAVQLGIADRLRWTGITNYVYRYLAIADLYVQPSRTEALGLAAVEAMSLGIPVVASRVGGLPELTSQLFEVGNSKELATLLNKLIANTEKRNNLGQKAYNDYEEKFKIEKGAEKYNELYHA